jgi:hypothetical protein
MLNEKKTEKIYNMTTPKVGHNLLSIQVKVASESMIILTKSQDNNL